MRLFDYDPDLFMEDQIASGKIKPKEVFENEGNHNNSDNLCIIGGNLLDKQG